MPPRSRKSASFVDRHDLWSDEQERPLPQVERTSRRKARSRAFLLRRPARRAARQDVGRVRSCKRDAQRRHHDHDAAREGHLASHRVPGVHAGRRLRLDGDAGRRRFRDGRRSRRLSACCLGRDEHRLDAVRYLFSATASRCRSRPVRFAATRSPSSRRPASIFSPGSKSNSICSNSKIRGLRLPTPPGRRRRPR